MAFYNTGIKFNSPVLLCSVPKCGTYLIGGIMSSILGEDLVVPSPENPIDSLFNSNSILSHKLQNRIYRGHFWYSDSLAESLGDIPKIILIRDPRDYVVSQAHFINNIQVAEHNFDYEFQRIKDWKTKLSIPIFGMRTPNGILSPVYDQFLNYGIKWMKSNNYLIVRFEDLVSQSLEENSKVIDTMKKIINFLNIDINIETLKERTFIGSNPSKSITFRSGRVGDWRQEFKPDHVLQMKLAAPRLVSALGYEDDEDWDITRSLKTYKQIDMELAQSLPPIPPNFKEVYHKMNSLSNTPDFLHILDVWYLKNNLDSGNFELVIETLQNLLSGDPMNGEWNYYMAFCLHMIKKYDEAILYYNRALEMGYYEFWVRYNRGSLYLTKGEIKKANDDIERAAILEPSHDGVKSMIELLRKHDTN